MPTLPDQTGQDGGYYGTEAEPQLTRFKSVRLHPDLMNMNSRKIIFQHYKLRLERPAWKIQ